MGTFRAAVKGKVAGAIRCSGSTRRTVYADTLAPKGKRNCSAKVLAQVPSEEHTELLQRHAVVSGSGELEEGLSQRELVGGHVAAEQDHGPPVGVERRGLGKEIGQMAGPGQYESRQHIIIAIGVSEPRPLK